MTENLQKMKQDIWFPLEEKHLARRIFFLIKHNENGSGFALKHAETITRTHTHTQFLLCCSVDLPSLSSEDLHKVEHFNQIS